jgi:hypothetical protein
MSTPDLCAVLDRLTRLCDQLEDAQDDRHRYRDLVSKIRAETDALQAAVCSVELDPPAT